MSHCRREQLVDVVEPGDGAHVPFGDVADALRVSQPGGGHQGDVAEGRAAEIGHDRPIALLPQPLGLGGEMFEQGIGDRAEFLEVVLDVELFVVDRRLADDGVEVESALGHPPAGRQRVVALGIHEDVAVWFRLGVEAAGDEDRRAVEGGPRLPVVVAEAEERLGPAQSDGVHAQRVEQVGGDLAQHLIGLDDFDRRARRIELQCLAEPIHAADVHARGRGGAEVQGDAVRLLVIDGGFNALSGVHGHYCLRQGRNRTK